MSLECSSCSEELCQSPGFLFGTCLEISQLLAQRSPPHNLPSPWRDWRQRARNQTSCPTRIPERCSSGPNGMTCFARRPTLSSTSSLLSLTSMWYIPTSHGSSLIYEFTENTLHSSVHERVDEFPQTAPLLVSSAALQLRDWIPPAPPASATCYPSARPRHLVRSSIESCRCGLSPREYQRHHLPVRPRALLARSSRAQDPQMREVSWSATPETLDQRLGLHTSTCLATRRDSVCASFNPHCCLETRDSWRVSPLYKPCAA